MSYSELNKCIWTVTFSEKAHTLFYFLLVALLCTQCSWGSDHAADVDSRSASEVLIDNAIEFHGVAGGELVVGFAFRDRKYTVHRSDEQFMYTSAYRSEEGNHLRKLSNAGYSETLNGKPVELSPRDSAARAASVNSVVYFALLPAFLKDDAVVAELEGEDEINGKTYQRVRVGFKEDGGGKDHDDVYLYWFDSEDHSMDYLAYSFYVDGGGTRFRAAYHPRRINGILFQDFYNYKGPASPDSLPYILDMYKSGMLEQLSQIELTKISIRLARDGR